MGSGWGSSVEGRKEGSDKRALSGIPPMIDSDLIKQASEVAAIWGTERFWHRIEGEEEERERKKERKQEEGVKSTVMKLHSCGSLILGGNAGRWACRVGVGVVDS